MENNLTKMSNGELVEALIESAVDTGSPSAENQILVAELLRRLNTCAALAKEALEHLMSDISEDHYRAGWLSGNGYSLWAMVLGGGRRYGMAYVATETVEKLKTLASLAGGWWAESDEFVPMTEWEARFAAHRKGDPHS